MFDSSAKVPTSNRPAGMATRMPATQVAKAGVRNRGWTLREDVGQQAVARHGEPDARLAELEDQDRRDHADERADAARPAAPSAGGGRRACSESRFSALTTGAASPATVCQGTMPVSTTATPM